MKPLNKKVFCIILILLTGCMAIGMVDLIWQPGYIIKSLVKCFFFVILPFIHFKWSQYSACRQFFSWDRKSFFKALLLGTVIFMGIYGGYILLQPWLDLSSVTTSLETNAAINRSNYIYAAIYIPIINALMEEFYFRGFGFLYLKKYLNKKYAYWISAIIFALYHIPVVIGWFNPMLFLFVLISLFTGGLLFNLLDDKSETLYPSWFAHLCANVAINMIGLHLFRMI